MSTLPTDGSSVARKDRLAAGANDGHVRHGWHAWPVAAGLMMLPFLAISPAGASEAGASMLAAPETAGYRLPGQERAEGETVPDALPSIAWRRPAFAQGPQDPAADPQAPDPPFDASQRPGYRSFGSQVGAVKWELAAVTAYYTALNGSRLFEDPVAPHFIKEGWFGRNTNTLGVDKLAHAYSGYVVAELFYARLKYKTGKAPGIQFTAAALASGVMLYTEAWDSIQPDGGWSWEDVAFNTLGAGFSILRNSVPDLDKKLDFRLMIVPNNQIFTREGPRHFEQQRYFFALKLSGFDGLDKGPLRFLELHAGYYGKDFELADRIAGIPPKRRIFVGVGINLRELFFKNPTGWAGRAAGEVLDYFQPPYTALHTHVTN